MKVALITYSTKPRGGVVHTLELGEALHASGVDVRVIALGDESVGFFRNTQVPHSFIGAPPWAETLDERVFRSVDALADGLRHMVGDFTILHTQDCIAARAAARVRDELAPDDPNRPIVVRTVHHVDDFTTQALIDCQRQAIMEPDELIVVSRQWQDIVAAEFGRRATVIYNGVNPEKVAPPSGFDRYRQRTSIGAESRFLFLTVGGIEPRKGTREMFEALAELQAATAQPPMLAIVGGHSFQDHAGYRDAALARAQQLGLELERDIVQLGTVTDAELAAWYQAADAFLFPSVKEGWGLVAMEALAAGLPLIASDIPVFREYLEPDVTALLVPPGDVAALTSAMRRLVADSTTRVGLASAGREMVQRFTWAAAASQQQMMYERIVAEAQPAL